MSKRTTKIISIIALVISAFFAEKLIEKESKPKSNIAEIIIKDIKYD